VDLGHGDVQRRLFVRFEMQVGKVEVFSPDPVAHLLGTFDGLCDDGDPLIPESPFVTLECLTPRFAFRREPRHRITELSKRERSLGVEKHEHEVSEPFQPVNSCHGRQSRPQR